MADADGPIRSPITMQVFAKALGRHLPTRLNQVRAIGRSIRAVGGSTNPKRKG